MGNAQPFARPKTMRRLVCTLPGDEVADAQLSVEEVPVPVPRNGEVRNLPT